ncbi:MAG: Eco57I restriction-modification methylase domain-containing protein [Saprospiraceae bacterium]
MLPTTPPDLITSLLFQGDVVDAVEAMASAGMEERGAVYTRLNVVEFMLDLVGYTADRPLYSMTILEPSFGNGDFLLPLVARLLQSWMNSPDKNGDGFEELQKCICAVELHGSTFLNTQHKLLDYLCEQGIPEQVAARLVQTWLIQSDFLLSRLPQDFDFVVGNPPYVRQERIPGALLAVYREKYSTMYDRADLYIPFIERSLRLLAPNGHLAFICSDRWTKNQYGGPLRKLVSKYYHLKIYVDMVDTPAFHSEVSAYPSIAVIAHQTANTTRIARRPVINKAGLNDLARALVAPEIPDRADVRELNGIMNGAEPWIFDSPDQLKIVRRLEKKFPTLEEAGCKVGIGVATGADEAFIGLFDLLDVEPSRKLRLVKTRDIASGKVHWRGLGLINPFEADGSLVNLDCYPRLRSYLEERKDRILNRHCARKSPASWYRTIDRIHDDLTARPKLLIPDIKGGAHIVYEPGELYPHHNLYYITSDEWDLRALQTVLRSGIANLFVSIYTTRMRGDYLRFQAQYLRRIRIPFWRDIPDNVKQVLLDAHAQDDVDASNQAVFRLYGLSKTECAVLARNEK